ncbi:Uncharacterised protein [Ralstonia mannitolilytica]|uniref:hypothetical protein n=1 Tax=Ralstonia mannitolilytica TaxID=105219 RepID=UPI000E040E20|nr:hypothetical protein [Ralstonia mannitolilytica]SUD94259.1 Uncharacterised protein [Ralstonia mannitolilytica]
MKTIEIKGWIFLQKYSWESAYSFQFSHLALDKHTGEGEVCVRVQEHTISVDVPDKIDTVSPQVKALEQKKEKPHVQRCAAGTQHGNRSFARTATQRPPGSRFRRGRHEQIRRP